MSRRGDDALARPSMRAYHRAMNVFDFSAVDLAGRERPLGEWRGQVLLIVNVASRCGFTPQYEGLQSLHERFAAQGLAVLGFPCDQFGHQEPGDAAEIRGFCDREYGVTFPLFAKIEVNGRRAHPLYRHLKAEQAGVLGTRAIKWNFTKFLVDRDGAVRGRYAPSVTPAQLEPVIRAALTS